MRYPELEEIPTSRELIDVFGGYNHNLRIGSGEFYDMKNLTSDDYPILSPRRQRGVYQTHKLSESLLKPQGLIAKDSLCYVDGDTLYINKVPIEKENFTLSADSEKTLISMGAYIIIMPDKMYINTENHNDCGAIEESVTTETTVMFTLCNIEGAAYNAESGDAEPDPKINPYWLDTSSTPNVLKMYSETDDMWVSVPTTYIKIEAVGIGKPFEVNDGVTISGIDNSKLSDLNSTMVIWAKGDDYIVVTGILDEETPTTSPITVKRQMPDMDFVIESQNRLWGCKYGLIQKDGKPIVVNEIYASKLGDFKNWNCFAGISTDSYAASVGTDGKFTGAITHLGYPIFFKENYMHKVYGNFPANYQIQTTACRGVQEGCKKSLAIVNETLYYKSRSAVCAYDGSLPVEISSALGDMTYSDAVAGTLGNKYYISMLDGNGNYNLFVYDSYKGMWHREDDMQVSQFCNCRGDLYFIDYGNKQIKTVRGTGKPEEKAIEWEAVTGIIGTDSPDKKYISRMDVRLSLAIGAKATFFIQYDSSGDWEHIYTISGTSLRTFAFPIRPKRCDHMRLKIVGSGEAKIFSICKTIEQGSDV